MTFTHVDYVRFITLPLSCRATLKDQPRRYEVMALRDTELSCLPLTEFENLRVSQAMALIDATRLRTPEQRVALSLSRQFWSRT